MILSALIFAAVMLTVFMYIAKEPLLGYPSGILWFLLGGHAYTLFVTPWVDIEFYIAFVSLFLGVHAIYASFAIRKRDLDAPDAGEVDGKFIDEEPDIKIEEPDQYEYIPRRERMKKESSK